LKAKILVIGASGFIGRRIVNALLATDRFAPIAVSRHATRASFGAGVEAVDLDAAHAEALRPLLAASSAVVNCVAGSPESILSSTQAIITAAQGVAASPRVVHLSSLAAYGSANGLVDEATPLRGDLGDYSAVKARTDGLMSACEFAVILRPGIVFGPSSAWWSDRIARLLVAHRLGDLGSQGSGICNLVYVDDVAQAVVRALDLQDKPFGAFNLAQAVPVTWNEYFARYARALGLAPLRSISATRLKLEAKVLSVPLKALELALRTPKMARWNPLPPIRPWLTEECLRTTCMDTSRASRVLNMQFTPLDAALQVTANWFRGGGRTLV
jgi:2-alkyl-3-oxoalkanoate reductase